MTRMGADGYSSAGSTQMSVKANSDLKNDFQKACEENGETMTDVIEESMREYVQVHGDGARGQNLPDDDQLASAYQALRQISDPDTGRVDVDAAKPAVASKVGISKQHVRRVVFDPLKRRNYLSPNFGSIIVHPPEEVEQ